MLDVHAPEHPISGKRDFFVHLFTITIGLVIALGLENAAEALHHRHQRKEAEANIRAELLQNQQDLKNGVPGALLEGKDLLAVYQFVQKRSKGEPADASGLQLVFHESPIQDSAWRTAQSTGALTYMDYSKVQRFAMAYKQQDLLQHAEELALEDYLQMQTFMPAADPAGLTQEDAVAALPSVRKTMGHLSEMMAVGRGTLGTYGEALQ